MNDPTTKPNVLTDGREVFQLFLFEIEDDILEEPFPVKQGIKRSPSKINNRKRAEKFLLKSN